MKSPVYFIPVSNSDNRQIIKSKLSQLITKSNLFDTFGDPDKSGSLFLRFAQDFRRTLKRSRSAVSTLRIPRGLNSGISEGVGKSIAVKMHFGEEGNTGFVHPEYVGIICDHIQNKGAQAFLTDTNTLYRGKRMNSFDHLQLAYEHRFTKDITGVDILIPDDTKKENTAEVIINQRFIKKAKISSPISKADGIVGVSHFKGHMMVGFGGALKNIGMGCASREGKLAQHSSVSPFVIMEKCTGCAACELVCPVKAIQIKDKKSFIDSKKCIGCASCIAACKYDAMEVDWESGAGNIQEKMIEYCLAILKDKMKSMVFLNFAIKITKECDCLAKDDPRISPDIGIFASIDPVSIDKASLDLINTTCSKDIFKDAHPHRNGFKQLEYAAKLGLGNLDYELIDV